VLYIGESNYMIY